MGRNDALVRSIMAMSTGAERDRKTDRYLAKTMADLERHQATMAGISGGIASAGDAFVGGMRTMDDREDRKREIARQLTSDARAEEQHDMQMDASKRNAEQDQRSLEDADRKKADEDLTNRLLADSGGDAAKAATLMNNITASTANVGPPSPSGGDYAGAPLSPRIARNLRTEADAQEGAALSRQDTLSRIADRNKSDPAVLKAEAKERALAEKEAVFVNLLASGEEGSPPSEFEAVRDRIRNGGPSPSAEDADAYLRLANEVGLTPEDLDALDAHVYRKADTVLESHLRAVGSPMTPPPTLGALPPEDDGGLSKAQDHRINMSDDSAAIKALSAAKATLRQLAIDRETARSMGGEEANAAVGLINAKIATVEAELGSIRNGKAGLDKDSRYKP